VISFVTFTRANRQFQLCEAMSAVGAADVQMIGNNHMSDFSRLGLCLSLKYLRLSSTAPTIDVKNV